MVLVDKLDEIGKPAWIALIVLGFIAVVAGRPPRPRLLFRERPEWDARHRQRRQLAAHSWQSKMERMQAEDGSLRSKHGPRSRLVGHAARSSGNRAFDEYRSETLRRLEDEQREFKEFLERLRFAKDRSEFDQFMAERRNRPPTEGPQAQPSADRTRAIVAFRLSCSSRRRQPSGPPVSPTGGLCLLRGIPACGFCELTGR